MATFKFRLTTLQRLREVERDDRRSQLADALQAERIIQERIDELDQEADAVRQMVKRAAGPGKLNVDQIMNSQRYEAQLRAERVSAEDRRQLILQEIERRREALAHADREVRILEKLREHQWDNFRKDEQKKEQRLFDEMANRVTAMKEQE
jgi:flagellar protein FliJ